MNEILDRAIILATQPYRDHDWIIRWLTESNGRIDTLARHARSPGSPFHGRIGLYNECRIQVTRRKSSGLYLLKECELLNHPDFLGASILRLSAIASAAAMIERLTETETPLGHIYISLEKLLGSLAGSNAAGIEGHYTIFEVELLAECGALPGNLPELLAQRIEAPTLPSPAHDFTMRMRKFGEACLDRQHISLPDVRSRFFDRLATELNPHNNGGNK